MPQIAYKHSNSNSEDSDAPEEFDNQTEDPFKHVRSAKTNIFRKQVPI